MVIVGRGGPLVLGLRCSQLVLDVGRRQISRSPRPEPFLDYYKPCDVIRRPANQNRSASFFAVHFPNSGFSAENFFNRSHHLIVFSNFPRASETLAKRAPLLDYDAPFTLVLIRA